MSWKTIGFVKQKKYFAGLVEKEQLSHAYLFSGPEMIGKQLFARDLAAVGNGRAAETDPDVKLLSPNAADGETKMYIEDVRDVKSFLSLRPYYGPYKFVIINDADRLTPEASNGLLKVLEEPSAKSVLILITSRPRMLLPTIASRCQQIRFLAHGPEAVQEYLTEAKVPEADQALLVSMAHGRLGWLVRQLAEGEKGIRELKDSILDFQKILKSGLAERMLYAKKLYEKETYPAVLASWLYWLHANQNQIPQAPAILKHLSALNTIISQPQYNHRLALENTLINL